MKRVFSILLFLLISFSVSVSVYGQGYRTFRWELEQIGPFRFFPTINFRDIGYDNNVYYQREEDNPISDYTATFSLQVKVYLLFGNTLILSLTENPEYVHYFKQKRERRWNNTLSPEFKFLFLNRFVISGRYSYRNRRWRASSKFDVRANELRESYKGSLFYETARRTSFGISALLEKISYEDITSPGQEIYLSRWLNREEKSANLEFYYRIFSEVFFFMNGGYTEYKFEHIQFRWRDSYSYQAYCGIRFPFIGRVRGTLSLGYKNHVPLSGEKKGFSGLIGNTRLDFRAGRFGLRILYNRDNHFSYWTDSIFFTEDRVGLGASYYLTHFLRLDYNYTYGKTHYPELIFMMQPDGNIEEIIRKDKYSIHMAGFVLRIIRRTGIGLVVNFWERKSNYYLENRNTMFVGGYITHEF